NTAQPNEPLSQQSGSNDTPENQEQTPLENFNSALQSHALHAHLTAIEQVLQNEVRSLHLAGHRIQTIQWLISELERARVESQANRIMSAEQALVGSNLNNPFATTHVTGNQVILDHDGNPL